ncbi:MAG: hypothetical protein PHX08_09995 [Lachnospiraceae bacterium]|nr:hypothetical protein [Lachnospiraceae bacterium]
MDVIEKTKMTKDEMIMELMALLKQNNMQKEANDSFELCTYVDSLEKKLDAMTRELSNMQQQLKEIQGDTILNHLRSEISESSERFQNRCNLMKEQLQEVKENINFTAKRIVSEFKIKGKEALNKVSELFKVKDKLALIRENVKEAGKEVDCTISKIDAFCAGIREANQKIANTFRTFADKPEVNYSEKEKRISKTEIMKKPWIKGKKILQSMEIRLDAAIDKVENVTRDVEITRMMKLYDTVMWQPDKERETVAMVAEAEHQYGADAFESFEKAKVGRGEIAVKPTIFSKEEKHR